MIEIVLGFVRDVVVPITIFVVVPVYFWFQRDRRKTQAETAVAERTVGVDVNAKEAGGLGASVAFVQEAFRVERESKNRRIKELEEEVHRVEVRCEAQVLVLRTEIKEKDRKIAELEKRLARLEGKVS